MIPYYLKPLFQILDDHGVIYPQCECLYEDLAEYLYKQPNSKVRQTVRGEDDRTHG